ncbi:hypothetical protein D3C87_1882220 [compost metagenome]
MIIGLERTNHSFAVRIQQAQMTLSLQQILMLMLTMNIDQLLADFPQHAEIDHLPVDAGRAFALGGDLTADNQMLLRLRRNAQTLQRFPYGMCGRQAEQRFHLGFVHTVADGIC